MMSMIGNTCPHCKASILQELRAWHFYTCESCKRPFIHSEGDGALTLIEHRETASSILIGSRGRVKSESFEITGCITLYQNNSLVNLFCILWSSGLYGYLIETEGRIAVSELIDLTPSQEWRKSRLGKNISIPNYGSVHCFSVSKTEEISISGEGKIYFPELKNSLFCSFFDQKEKALYTLFSKNEMCLIYGAFYKLEELGLSNTRYLPTWNTHKKIPAPLTLACPECHKTVKVFSHYRAKHICCASCATISVFNSSGELRQVRKLGNAKSLTFKLGTLFLIEDSEFILISYTVKRENVYNTDWNEYTLFNPDKGCWYLNESEGHYNLVKPWRSYISEDDKRFRTIEKDGQKFQLYNKYKYKVVYAGGEFLTNILTMKAPACADYTAPPHLLSVESNGEEVNWFEGRYCDHSTVKSWLSEPVDLETKSGIAPNQPFALHFDAQSLTRLSVIGFFAIILIQILLSAFITTSTPVYAKSFGMTDTLNTRTIVSDQFEITENNCAADFVINSNVNNSWLEADFTLVNETTGDQYFFSKSVEYYWGTDDGEGWSEGSKETTVTVNSITKGKYHMNILLTNDGQKVYHNIDVTVIQNVSLMKNFVISLLFFVVFPTIVALRRRAFDRKQWFNSNYSPYTYD